MSAEASTGTGTRKVPGVCHDAVDAMSCSRVPWCLFGMHAPRSRNDKIASGALLKKKKVTAIGGFQASRKTVVQEWWAAQIVIKSQDYLLHETDAMWVVGVAGGT